MMIYEVPFPKFWGQDVTVPGRLFYLNDETKETGEYDPDTKIHYPYTDTFQPIKSSEPIEHNKQTPNE